MHTPATNLSILTELTRREKLSGETFARALSAAKVEKTKQTDKPVQLPDGGGLVLHIPPTGAKIWRYRFRLLGKGQILTIGQYPEVSLAQARDAHRAARWLVARGTAPLAYINQEIERRYAEARAGSENSFGNVARRWMAATESTLSTRTVKHRQAMLEKHIFPVLADRPIAELVKKELHELLVGIDQHAPETAKHCRGYIKQIFEYAIDAELVMGDPTPRRKSLTNASKRKVVPRKKIVLGRIGEFLKTLEDAPETDPVTKAALKLLVLTWCRTSEVVDARWNEIDLDAGTWIIPEGRMKAREEHRIFLSRQAVELLREQRQLAPHDVVFPNRRRPSEPMHRMTLTAWRKRHGFADEMEIHGFRSTASTWANESGRFNPDAIEVALAHKEADRTRAAYNRAEFIDDLKRLWQDWADLCDQKVALARAAGLDESAG
ncbi:MAG: tyrosine-type recombinase/integrase [Proteobacteria bacterium]|nr:tyrosine-type recombinase/integrase [Pseudomonadota bacterium]